MFAIAKVPSNTFIGSLGSQYMRSADRQQTRSYTLVTLQEKESEIVYIIVPKQWFRLCERDSQLQYAGLETSYKLLVFKNLVRSVILLESNVKLSNVTICLVKHRQRSADESYHSVFFDMLHSKKEFAIKHDLKDYIQM